VVRLLVLIIYRMCMILIKNGLKHLVQVFTGERPRAIMALLFINTFICITALEKINKVYLYLAGLYTRECMYLCN